MNSERSPTAPTTTIPCATPRWYARVGAGARRTASAGGAARSRQPRAGGRGASCARCRRAAISDFLGGGMNRWCRRPAHCCCWRVQLRNSVSPPDAAHLREQVIAQVRQFESHAQAAGIAGADDHRRALRAVRDARRVGAERAVGRAERLGRRRPCWSTFHGESYGGEKFFQILERLCADFTRHIDLIELMYLCLALGFGGRYQIESGGRAKLADIQEDLYRRIKAQRAPAADELAPHWRGIEDRRNPLIRYVPLWVVAAAACLRAADRLRGVLCPAQHAVRSRPARRIAQIGLESATPPDDAGVAAGAAQEPQAVAGAAGAGRQAERGRKGRWGRAGAARCGRHVRLRRRRRERTARSRCCTRSPPRSTRYRAG